MKVLKFDLGAREKRGKKIRFDCDVLVLRNVEALFPTLLSPYFTHLVFK